MGILEGGGLDLSVGLPLIRLVAWRLSGSRRLRPIRLPPLRERLEDVPLGALALLRRYDWPGNVRELRNTIERARLLSDTRWLEAADISIPGRPGAQTRFDLPPNGVILGEVERELLAQALERAQWNQTRAAELLGMNVTR